MENAKLCKVTMSFRLSSCGGVSRHSAALNTQQIINKSIVFIKNFFIAHHFFVILNVSSMNYNYL